MAYTQVLVGYDDNGDPIYEWRDAAESTTQGGMPSFPNAFQGDSPFPLEVAGEPEYGAPPPLPSTPSLSSSSGGGSTGLPPGVDPTWWEAFKKEHGGVDPSTFYKGRLGDALNDKAGSEAWASMHGSPQSWGNKPGDNRVPLGVFRSLASASRSPDVGPQGPMAWAKAADALRGVGSAYHPAGTGATSDRAARMFALLFQ